MPRKKTYEEFIQEVRDKYGDEYTVLGEYINSQTKIKVRHNSSKCNNYEWEITPNRFLRGQGCPICGKIKSIKNRTKNHEDFVKEIEDKYGNEYEILGEYINAKTKIKVRHNCEKCNNHEWEVDPHSLLRKHGCPVCSGRIAKLGVNTIWDTNKWMVDLGVSEEDAKKYTHSSSKTIMVRCPDCGREKKIIISNLYICKSIFCSCGDGKSYPEKFVMGLLEQLEVDFETEYSPSWIDNKRYDFYIKDLNCIIETHGEQHYKEKLRRVKESRTLQEEQVNDKFKKEIALKNGVKYYITLDCRESNLEWIKKSIINSELNDLFNLSIINWTGCAEFANKNIIKEVCDYWNSGVKSTIKIGEKFNIHCGTVTRHLKKGTKLGWCDYNAKEVMKRIGKQNGGYNKKEVEIFKNGKSLGFFESCTEIQRQSEELFGVKLLRSKISQVCNNKKPQYKGFTFKYVEENNNLNI
ncbi:zinc-ribbon domain-containing protein (plasmid) [Clostridium perfringens]